VKQEPTTLRNVPMVTFVLIFKFNAANYNIESVKAHLRFLVSVRVYSLVQWSNIQSKKHEDNTNGICCASIIKPQTVGYLRSLLVSLFDCHSLVHKANVNVSNFFLITFSSQGEELANEVTAASKTR
jgi:hypothetical protein